MKQYVIIRNGIIDINNMVRNNIDINSLIKYLKRRRVYDIENVELLIVLYNKIYFLKKIIEPVSIIINGKIMYINLFKIRKNKEWLNSSLLKNNIKINNILYAVYLNKRLYIIKMSN